MNIINKNLLIIWKKIDNKKISNINSLGNWHFLCYWQKNILWGGNLENRSHFDGGLLSYVGWIILGSLITSCTFGICYPWALCMIYGWKINHTVIEGRRLQFNGTAVGLFGNWIKWLLLIVVTLGIYSFWVHIKLEQWRVKNTTFLN